MQTSTFSVGALAIVGLGALVLISVAVGLVFAFMNRNDRNERDEDR